MRRMKSTNKNERIRYPLLSNDALIEGMHTRGMAPVVGHEILGNLCSRVALGISHSNGAFGDVFGLGG